MTGEQFSHSSLQVVEALQGLQKTVDQLDETDLKIARMRQGIGILAAGRLLGHQYFVDSAQVFGKIPNEPDERILFGSGMLFIGRLDSYAYLADPEIPVDSLSLNFVEPEIFGASPDEVAELRRLTLQVPVLAIDSCSSAEAA